jgi:hypothetical protein
MKPDARSFNLSGFDDDAGVYFENGIIRRIYNLESSRDAHSVFETLNKVGFAPLSIVDSKIESYEIDGNLILQHKALFFAHPTNWTPIQLLKVCKLTIELNIGLREYGLVLKDMLPENLTFHDTKPIFIDFASIVDFNKLQKLEWLNEVRKNQKPEMFILKNMFFRFMLIPLIIGALDSPKKMSHILGFNFCNSGNNPPNLKRLNLFRVLTTNKLKTMALTCKIIVKIKFSNDHIKIEGAIIKYLQNLEASMRKNISPYLDYYNSKNEAFDFKDQSNWKNKQMNLNLIYEKFKPKSLLDIGANTGWYSILASQKGIRVTSVDEDMASIEDLFKYSDENSLPINCLVATYSEISNSCQSVFPSSRNKNSQLFPQSRFNHEMVIALGLIHHLCLGDGIPVSEIVKVLAMISSKYLVIEFVELEDDKILNENSFFPQFQKMSPKYSKEELILNGLKYFSGFEEFPSEPSSTRGIIVFIR